MDECFWDFQIAPPKEKQEDVPYNHNLIKEGIVKEGYLKRRMKEKEENGEIRRLPLGRKKRVL